MDGSCWAESLLTSHYCSLFLVMLFPVFSSHSSLLQSFLLFMHDPLALSHVERVDYEQAA